MSKTGKSSGAQRTRRKVQTSSARSRKSVSRPNYAKKTSTASQKRSKVRASQVKTTKKANTRVAVKKDSSKKATSVAKKNTRVQEQPIEKVTEQKLLTAKSQTEQNEEAQSNKQNAKAQHEPERAEEIKVNFVENSGIKIEKRPLGAQVTNVDIMQSPSIRHFAEVSEETVLAEMEQVGKTSSESLALEKALSNFETEHPEASERPIISGFDIKRVNQKLEERKNEMSASSQTEKRQTAKELKEDAIKKALANISHREKDFQQKRRLRKVNFGFKRTMLALFCATAAVLAIVYFVNQNAPDASIRVAAMENGINASYPSYVPRDFSLSDITSENGKITLNFKNMNTGDAFTLVEESYSGDGTKLIESYLTENYGDEYNVVREQGLTLYSTSRLTCWVSNGTFYRLSVTSGSLTKKQIKTIALSL